MLTNPDPGYGPQFLFTSPRQDFTTTAITTTTTVTSTITTTTATTTTSTTTNFIATTTTIDSNDGSKIRIKWPLKSI